MSTSSPPDSVPRRNGELVFDAPWQSRAFGLAAAYLDATGQGWAHFRPFLITAIAELPDSTPYYEAWVLALDRLVTADEVGVSPQHPELGEPPKQSGGGELGR